MTATTARVQLLAPLPHRPVQWGRALRALRRIGASYSSEAIMDFALALEGDDGERGFQELIACPEGIALAREGACLATLLDAESALAAMPEGSLGRAYLALAQRDRIRVGDLVAGTSAWPDELERAPDPWRRWFRDRATAAHDLLHVLSGYDRDRAGETALLAFAIGCNPKRVLRVSLALALLVAPKRRSPALIRYLYRAWRRGQEARIPRATRWEALLPLPLAEARARLGIRAASEVHPEGVWREDAATGAWSPAEDAAGGPRAAQPRPSQGELR